MNQEPTVDETKAGECDECKGRGFEPGTPEPCRSCDGGGTFEAQRKKWDWEDRYLRI